MSCPTVLGTGVTSGRVFCDVLTEREPEKGIIIKLPKRQGPATLTFDLHNRHVYSEQQEEAGRAYTRYTATIGVLTMDNTLLTRALVRSEFREAPDLFDRVAVESDPALLKAVAPLGAEPIFVEIPEDVEAVTILGEKLAVVRMEREMLYTTGGRPIAVISQPMVEFRPPVSKPTPRRRTR
jgi:hypothetical protein